MLIKYIKKDVKVELYEVIEGNSIYNEVTRNKKNAADNSSPGQLILF